MASKTNTGSFYGLIRPLFLVLAYGFNFQQGTRIDKTWWDVCSFCFVYSYKIHNRVLIKKTALAKLLEHSMDESSKLINISDKRLRYLTKSLLSQIFYCTMSDLSKVLFAIQVDLFNKLGITSAFFRISGNLTIIIDLLKASCQFFGVDCMFFSKHVA